VYDLYTVGLSGKKYNGCHIPNYMEYSSVTLSTEEQVKITYHSRTAAGGAVHCTWFTM